MRDALALDADTPIVRVDARSGTSCTTALITLVEHALARSGRRRGDRSGPARHRAARLDLADQLNGPARAQVVTTVRARACSTRVTSVSWLERTSRASIQTTGQSSVRARASRTASAP